jgi:hypothetical protein
MASCAVEPAVREVRPDVHTLELDVFRLALELIVCDPSGRRGEGFAGRLVVAPHGGSRKRFGVGYCIDAQHRSGM